MVSILFHRRPRFYHVLLTAAICVMSLSAFDCQPAENPCDTECSDDDGTICLMIPPSNVACYCQCAWGDVGIFIEDESGEVVDERHIQAFQVPRNSAPGEQWCSLPTVPTCKELNIGIALLCKDSDCYGDVFWAEGSPFVTKIPCGGTKTLWVTFGCNYYS